MVEMGWVFLDLWYITCFGIEKGVWNFMKNWHIFARYYEYGSQDTALMNLKTITKIQALYA